MDSALLMADLPVNLVAIGVAFERVVEVADDVAEDLCWAARCGEEQEKSCGEGLECGGDNGQEAWSHQSPTSPNRSLPRKLADNHLPGTSTDVKIKVIHCRTQIHKHATHGSAVKVIEFLGFTHGPPSPEFQRQTPHKPNIRPNPLE